MHGWRCPIGPSPPGPPIDAGTDAGPPRPFEAAPARQRVLTSSAASEALRALDGAHPGFGERLFDETGALRRFVNVFVADEDIRFLEGLDTPVDDGQTVSIVPAVAGG